MHCTTLRDVRPGLAAASLALSMAHAATAADAAAYEPFNYGAAPNLLLMNGGTGWAGAWYKLSTVPTGVVQDGLAWPNLVTTGGSAITPAYGSTAFTRYSRALAAGSVSGSTLFVSFLVRPNIGYGQGGGLAFGTWENGVLVGAVPGAGAYGLSTLQGPGLGSEVPVVLSQTALMVARAVVNNDGTVTWSAFANPTVGQPMPAFPDAEMTVAGTALPAAVYLYNDGGFSTDEIRFGTTWESVLPSLAPSCPADLDGSGTVDGTDLGLLLGAWGTAPLGDLDSSGSVDGTDLGLLLGAWGTCG